MKKLLVVLLALTAMGMAVFADDMMAPTWTWGATIKTGAAIVVGDSTSTPDAQLWLNNADDPNLTRIRLDAEAAMGDTSVHIRVGGDFAGYTIDKFAADTGLFIANWWVNNYFMDKMIQTQFGVLDHPVTDTVNKGWGGLNVSGAQFVVMPMSGVAIGLAIPIAPPPPFNTVVPTFADGLRGIHVGFGYTMTDLVTLRFTWINSPVTNASELDAGVAVLAVPNLTAQLEAQVKSVGDSSAQTIELFENAVYVMGPLSPGIEGDQVLYSASGAKAKIGIKPKIDYLLMSGVNLGASVAYTMNTNGSVGGDTASLVVDPYVKFTFNPKASLKIDAAYTIPDLKSTGTWNMPINFNFIYAY